MSFWFYAGRKSHMRDDSLRFYNAKIFQRDSGFLEGSFEVVNGVFTSVGSEQDIEAKGTDLEGAFVIPGLIDIHTHGNKNADFSDGDIEGLTTMAGYLLQNGITAFLPTSMTLPAGLLEKAFRSCYEFTQNSPYDCAEVLGIHMEGPYLSEKRKGAQNAEFLESPNFASFKKLQKACGNLIRIVDVAPELGGAKDFIREAVKDTETLKPLISIAHTDADYETALSAFELGARHVTHLFNGMPGLHHRNPGVIGAAFDQDDVTVELICDGVHVHPSVVRAAFKMFSHRICLISDSLRCCGMPDGEYELGGQRVILKGGEARLEDGTLAGSVTNLFDCMKKAVSFGIPLALAVEAATYTPAKCLGLENKKGSIQPGNDADFIICDENLNILRVYRQGKSKF